jgi:hypothetical protein
MLANGGSAQALTSMIKNGKVNHRLAPFIPYLGMSLGMVASNIVSEALHSENFKACAMDIATLKGFHADACDKAYKAWTEGGGIAGIADQWAPGLVSLVTTTILTTAIQAGLTFATGQVIKIAGVELATFFVPGGIWIKSLRAVGFVSQLTLFTKVNNTIDPFFTKLYQNFRQGSDFNTLEAALTRDLSGVMTSNWQSARLNQDLTQLAIAMKAWRAMNLMDVNMAQSSWSQNLNNFAGLYNISKEFYSGLVSESLNKKKYPLDLTIIEQVFPLNGITPKDFNKDRMDGFLTQPDFILSAQLKTIRDVSQKLDQMYASNQAYLSSLNPNQRQTLLTILSALRSQDVNKIGQAMDLLNFKIKDITESTFGINTDFVKTLKSIKSALGQPNPIWSKGTGYATYFLMTPEFQSASALDHQEKFWFNHVSFAHAESTADWLMASTLWGPDTGKLESVISSRAGFYSQFLAPRLPLTSNTEYVCASDALTPISRLNVCDKGVRYDNPLHFAATHLGSQVSNYQGFNSWWQKYSETPYVQTWVDFENKYQSIVRELMAKMWASDAATNHGDVANGIVASSVQELKVNALALGGVMKARLEETGRRDLLAQLLAKQANSPLKLRAANGDRLRLFALLRQNNNLDLRAVVQTQGYDTSDVPLPTNAVSLNFAWQNTLLKDVDGLINLLRQIRPQTVRLSTGTEFAVVSSQITNAQFQEQQQEVQETLKAIAQVLASIGLSAEQQKTAELCLKNMESIVHELTSLAMVANAVSYKEVISGGLMKARCTSPQSLGKGVQFVQRAAEGCTD